jgi:hypothetical protein
MLESFIMTHRGYADLIFRVDDDDLETQQYLKNEHVIVGPRLEGYKSTPVFYNELYRASTGDVLIAGNDDMLFITPGWDKAILDEANKYPDGIFDFGVNTHNEANFPFLTISRKMADAVGFLFDVRFFWGDIFWRDVTSAFGRAIPLPTVCIDHEWAGFKPDLVFYEGEGTRRSDHSQFHSLVVNEAIEKLRAL